jgi:heme exporter protein D
VTRGWISIALSLLALAVGLCAALVVAHNHARADRLAQLQRRLEMQRAANDQGEARAAAHVWGLADDDGALVERAPALPGGQP